MVSKVFGLVLALVLMRGEDHAHLFYKQVCLTLTGDKIKKIIGNPYIIVMYLPRK